MANPQSENGHVDIANEIVDRLCSYRIPGEEWMILWVILRKTYGWHKKEDEISVTQFEKITHLKRASVYRSIKSLLAKRLIGVSKEANSGINLYRFNKDFDEWGGISKSATPISRSANATISKRATHKRKERNTTLRDAPNPEIKIFIDWWFDTFKARFGCPYVITGKDGSLVKILLKSLPLKNLQESAILFLDSKDEWIKKTGYSIGMFSNQINKLNSQKPKRSILYG